MDEEGYSEELRRRKREKNDKSVTQKQRQRDGTEVQTVCLPRGPGWPKVSQQTAQCVTPHFVNNIASYFWRMGASTLAA